MDFNELSGKVVTPCDDTYGISRLEYNLSINKFPLAINYCYKQEDVCVAIKWCRRNNVNIRIRTGGHNYEGYSTGNGVLIIDTSKMNKIEVNTESDTVKIQAGTKLASIYSTLAKYGMGFPGGTCPTVGISGVVLGGGIGLSTRLFGLAADNLVELELVNWKGELLTANEHENPELFWACRGAGGGNFGVAISYTFKTYKVDKITLIELRWNAESRESFLNTWQHWLSTADKRISCFAGFSDNGIFLNSFFYGTPQEARKILEDFLSLDGLLPESRIEYVPFIDAVKAIFAQYGPPNKFQATGRFVYKKLTAETIQKLVELVNNSPIKNTGEIRLYSLGGKVKDLDNTDTAFFYRKAHYIMAITIEWNNKEEEAACKKWLAEGLRYIESFTEGSYINFPYLYLENYLYQYYGFNVKRLRKVKRIYDPYNIFKFQQSIKDKD